LLFLFNHKSTLKAIFLIDLPPVQTFLPLQPVL